MTYLKGYMKAVKAHLATANPDRVAAFEKGAAAYAKKCVVYSFVLIWTWSLTVRDGTGSSAASTTGSSSPASR